MTDRGVSNQTAIFLQDACYKHRFIRSNDVSLIVERPERLRALKLGLSAAISRIEENSADSSGLKESVADVSAADDLVAVMQKLDLVGEIKTDLIKIIKSNKAVNLLDNEAVKFVHGDVDDDVYLKNLVKWTRESTEKIKAGESEIPLHLAQGDLYLCPESLDAIQGALGTTCEAIDYIMQVRNGEIPERDNNRTRNAFVAIRPPGHHCGEDTPSGFCFANNVVVGAAHAHLKHAVEKVIIFDIDLHHGNGTQSLVWQINEETYRKTLETEAGSQSGDGPGLQIFYGSVHDILSYPCEDGKLELVQAASVSVHGPHGQHIENIHLEKYATEEEFWEKLYYAKYSKLFDKAKAFSHGADPENVLVFISCGFDASEHEYPSMSRHNRRVPTSFYHRFAVDARDFASEVSKGKLISVLEGGYSDRALMSGGMAHISGLVDMRLRADEKWWSIPHLNSLEKYQKKRRGGKVSLPGPGEKWLERALQIFQFIEPNPPQTRMQAPVPPSSRTLRERKAPTNDTENISPVKDSIGISTDAGEPASVDDVVKELEALQLERNDLPSDAGAESLLAKKLPRVILRVKEPQGS